MTGAPPPPAQDEADLRPASVRLGSVVPPEDPEDWTRPLTWLAAAGMLAAPLTALAWFLVAPPTSASGPVAGTWAVAFALVLGAVVTGATQIGRARAFAGTLGAALFGVLATIVVGVVMTGERQAAAVPPTLSHAFVAALSGLTGAAVASAIAPLFAGLRSRPRRALAPAAIGIVVTILAARFLFVGQPAP